MSVTWEQIQEAVDHQAPEAVRVLQELVRIPSRTNDPGIPPILEVLCIPILAPVSLISVITGGSMLIKLTPTRYH